MFHKHRDIYEDLSIDMRDPDDWNVGILRSFDYPLDITALATEPISRLLAVGTAGGFIYVFGGPGVETRLKLPEPVGVKFLHFATSSFKLVCMDANSLLHVWDLSSYGRPKFLISARFDLTNFLTLSPSHDHLFVSLNSGEIRTYDLACLRKSPYTIPNLWKLHEREIVASGAPDMSTPESCTIVETVGHPRNLTLLFIAYSGGVILSDLTKSNTVGAFELVLPPGAPGGLGYGDCDLLRHRKPPVTAIAIHPTGHFFVVGHADGSLAFWAVLDHEQPLLVRTLDEIDVNVVNPETLSEHMSRASKGSLQTDREPIFKLSWSALAGTSDPRGGETTLTIFGGLHTNQATGITVYLFPAFNPRESMSSDQQLLPPHMRTAMQESLNHSKTFFYYTRGIVQDYLLVPRESPHFAGTSDPIAILLLTEGTGASRVVEAFQFPPPEFSIPLDTEDDDVDSQENKKDPVDTVCDDLESTLRSLQVSDEPKRLQLPSALMNGTTGLLNGQLLKVETDTYQTLVDRNTNHVLYLPLEGGLAWADDTKKTELKLSKHQPHRLAITYNLDLTIRFYDISAQLLDGLKPTPIKNNFPNSLPALTIDLKLLFMDPFVSRRTSPTILDCARIDSVSLAQESRDVVVTLQTGQVVVYRLSSHQMAKSSRGVSNELLLLLEHVPVQPGDRFSPYFMLTPGAGRVEACAISDLGFLAAAYSDGSLYVVDMRGPHIILRQSQNTTKKNRRSVGLHLSRSESSLHIRSLVWTVSSLEEDSHSRVRLIALYTSGFCEIYTIIQSDSFASWTCEGPISAEGVAHPLPQGSFVIDCKSGNKWKANRAGLNQSTRSTTPRCAFVTCGLKGAKCFANITGEKIARTDWGSKIGAIQGAQIIERLGSHALVVFTDIHYAVVYSLPHLELIHTLSLPAVTSMALTMDESGDFLAWIPHSPSGIMHQATYGTLFDIRRASGLPDIDFLCTKPDVSPQPQPVSMGPPSVLGSWFPFSQSMTGDQLDTMLGGPNRPVPKSERQPQSSTGTSNVAAAAAAAVTQSTNLYNRLAATLNERGQALGDLEDQFNALEEGSKSMVAQAKRLATQYSAKQTAKSWFG